MPHGSKCGLSCGTADGSVSQSYEINCSNSHLKNETSDYIKANLSSCTRKKCDFTDGNPHMRLNNVDTQHSNDTKCIGKSIDSGVFCTQKCAAGYVIDNPPKSWTPINREKNNLLPPGEGIIKGFINNQDTRSCLTKVNNEGLWQGEEVKLYVKGCGWPSAKYENAHIKLPDGKCLGSSKNGTISAAKCAYKTGNASVTPKYKIKNSY